MYPYDIIAGVDLYDICLVLAILSVLIFFRILADREGLKARVQNLVLFTIFFAVFVGYPSAIFVQAIYNAISSGSFSLSASTGATFYGGLIGGALGFILFYFIVGHFRCKDKAHIRTFPTLMAMAGTVIPLAHAIGRVGCFFAGCCYGAPTDGPLGVQFHGLSIKVLPVQLFEAAFLLLLSAYALIRFLEHKPHNMSVYLIGYGIWRFFIEYLRGDDRGETLLSFLSPSQLTAIVLSVVGVLLIVLHRYIDRMEQVGLSKTGNEES